MHRSPRTIREIVDEQIYRWQLERSRRAHTSMPPPVVTVSRQYGARGAAVAHLVAERLGFGYWNRELLAEMAQHAGAAQQLFATLDEHHLSALDATLRGMVNAPVGASEYFRELAHVVHGIGARGGAVIVGRGAQYMLPAERTLRVRVVAPLEARIAGLVERRGVDESEARAELEQVDRDRAAFIRDHYGRDPDDVSAYDLMVNTTTLGLPGATDVIVAACRARFPASASASTVSGS